MDAEWTSKRDLLLGKETCYRGKRPTTEENRHTVGERRPITGEKRPTTGQHPPGAFMSSDLAGHMAILGILWISDSLTRRTFGTFDFPVSFMPPSSRIPQSSWLR
jgi:hypothetical protein